MSQPLTRLLVALNLTAAAALGGGAVIVWQQDTAPSAERAAPDVTSSLPARPAPVTFAAARNQPIFTPTRRLPPEPAEQTETGEPASSLPAPHLMGVLRVGQQRAMALLKDAGSGEQEWVVTGRAISGWTVVDIQSQAVRLERAGEGVTVRLLPNEQLETSAAAPPLSGAGDNAALLPPGPPPPASPPSKLPDRVN